jgi:hypothetical protein
MQHTRLANLKPFLGDIEAQACECQQHSLHPPVCFSNLQTNNKDTSLIRKIDEVAEKSPQQQLKVT